MISRLSTFFSILLLAVGFFHQTSGFQQSTSIFVRSPPPQNPYYYFLTKKKPTFIILRNENNIDDSSTNNDGSSFSSKRNLIKSKVVELQSKLQAAGRAGLLAYGFMNLAFYAFSTCWCWSSLSPGGTTLSSQIRKLGKVLGIVYAGSQLTKIFRISLAVVCAPIADRLLGSVKVKMDISEGKAMGILTVGMILSFLGILASLTIGSTLIA